MLRAAWAETTRLVESRVVVLTVGPCAVRAPYPNRVIPPCDEGLSWRVTFCRPSTSAQSTIPTSASCGRRPSATRPLMLRGKHGVWPIVAGASDYMQFLRPDTGGADAERS